MARKIFENERFLKYKEDDSVLTIWLFSKNKPSIGVNNEIVSFNKSQARHIAKKLNQFADNIEIDKIRKESNEIPNPTNPALYGRLRPTHHRPA